MELIEGTITISLQEYEKIKRKLDEYEMLKKEQLDFASMNEKARLYTLMSIAKYKLEQDVQIVGFHSPRAMVIEIDCMPILESY